MEAAVCLHQSRQLYVIQLATLVLLYLYQDEMSSIGKVRLTWQTSLTGTTKILVLICLGRKGLEGQIRSGTFLLTKPSK